MLYQMQLQLSTFGPTWNRDETHKDDARAIDSATRMIQDREMPIGASIRIHEGSRIIAFVNRLGMVEVETGGNEPYAVKG